MLQEKWVKLKLIIEENIIYYKKRATSNTMYFEEYQLEAAAKADMCEYFLYLMNQMEKYEKDFATGVKNVDNKNPK